MRWLAVSFVLAHLLLRGATVPHTHEAGDYSPEKSSRAHVHLNWHSAGHGLAARHDHHASDGSQHETSPAHEDDVLYVDDADWLSTSKSEGVTDALSLDWTLTSGIDANLLTAPRPQSEGTPRPPGETSDTIQTFLPHVLRI